ncbi:class I glutamine amidotransferase-like protein [Dendrothele bispora CBS 962.96]|uniref:Class I glutamine amidotransferase-like protein n=1 Tax=Dendrothele bispora (strain CBS 962.96) TaxID=1314807 RepID=A0A4V4HFG6_DENBC|nr:class I glutamine amidotransferase-like protein [Dendrothele bispora CBS 962.96]
MSTSSSQDPLPSKFGVLVFPAFQALDAFGPLDAFNNLADKHKMDLAIIAKTLEPVSTKYRDPAMNPFGSNFGESIVPTHDFITAPPLDVLLIPGGLGTRADEELESLYEFVRKTYPSLKYILTVCTGSRIAARAGILDGKRATTNKNSFEKVKAVGPNVKWVSHARWVVDGNVWTSSGVSAGTDMALAWIEEVFGKEMAEEISRVMEYERHLDPNDDPFADLYNLPREG